MAKRSGAGAGIIILGLMAWGAVAGLTTSTSNVPATSPHAQELSPQALISASPIDYSSPTTSSPSVTERSDEASFEADIPSPKHRHRGHGFHAAGCESEEYRSTDGSCVHRPYHTNHHVAGETAVCRDGTHSVSHHHQGTCSHHGGVALWD